MFSPYGKYSVINHSTKCFVQDRQSITLYQIELQKAYKSSSQNTCHSIRVAEGKEFRDKFSLIKSVRQYGTSNDLEKM